MSFAAPLVLLALLALPLLVAWYAAEQRRRRAAAAVFAAPALQPSLAPLRPRWRRHAPILAVVLALIVLVAAAARPQRTVAVPVERASIMLATDVSGSMTASDVQPSRLVAAKRAARRFLDAVPARVNVGLLEFNGQTRVRQTPTTERDGVRAAIDAMAPSGGTATGDAIAAATQVLSRRSGPGRRPPAAVVLLSDGASTSGRDPDAAAREARRLRIPIYTVTLGTESGTITVPRRGGGTETRPVPPDRDSLARIARGSGGEAFDADSADRLKQVYEQLGSRLGHRDEQRQLTSAFAGGGLLLLLGGAAMSLRWFGRLI